MLLKLWHQWKRWVPNLTAPTILWHPRLDWRQGHNRISQILNKPYKWRVQCWSNHHSMAASRWYRSCFKLLMLRQEYLGDPVQFPDCIILSHKHCIALWKNLNDCTTLYVIQYLHCYAASTGFLTLQMPSGSSDKFIHHPVSFCEIKPPWILHLHFYQK